MSKLNKLVKVLLILIIQFISHKNKNHFIFICLKKDLVIYAKISKSNKEIKCLFFNFHVKIEKKSDFVIIMTRLIKQQDFKKKMYYYIIFFS